MKYDLNFSALLFLVVIASFIYYKRKKFILDTDYFIFLTCLIYLFYVIKFAFFPVPIGKDYINTLKEINDAYGRFSYSNNFNIEINFNELTNFYNFIFLMPAAMYLWYYKSKKIVGKILAVSISIEVIQAIISLVIGYPYKIFDINDIILNVSGGLLTYFIISLFHKLYLKFIEPKISKLIIFFKKRKLKFNH